MIGLGSSRRTVLRLVKLAMNPPIADFLKAIMAIPPVDTAVPDIQTALDMQDGHIRSPFARVGSMPGLFLLVGFGFGPFAHSGMQTAPALVHILPVLFVDQAESGVVKLDECSAVALAQAILQIRDRAV